MIERRRPGRRPRFGALRRVLPDVFAALVLGAALYAFARLVFLIPDN